MELTEGMLYGIVEFIRRYGTDRYSLTDLVYEFMELADLPEEARKILSNILRESGLDY